MRIIPTQVHGLMDYLVGALLIAAPWVLGFATGGIAHWLPVGVGVAIIGLSMFTKYEWGAFRVINMPTHLALDAITGAFLASSPWLFGFSDFVWAPHLIVGLIEIGTAALSQTTPSFETKGHQHQGQKHEGGGERYAPAH